MKGNVLLKSGTFADDNALMFLEYTVYETLDPFYKLISKTIRIYSKFTK